MINIVKHFFNKVTETGSGAEDRNTGHDKTVAVFALFLEMARIDETFSSEEMDVILAILKKKYGLSQEHADALIADAEKELIESIDYWQFAKRINENYSTEEKIEIIESFWQIIFVDQKMDKHENYLIHKLSNLLRLSHDQLIDAKLKVLCSG